MADDINVKSLRSRIVLNFSWTAVSQVVGKGSAFLANIYLARTLGVESFGLFVLAQTITSYFWLSVDLGINMYGIKEIARDRNNSSEMINTLLTMRIVMGLIIFLLYCASLFMFFDLTYIDKFTFIGCGFYLMTYSFSTDWVCKGLERFNYFAFYTIITSISFLAGVVLLVNSASDIAVAAFIWSFSFLVGSVYLMMLLRNKAGIHFRPSFDFKFWIHHLKESIFFTIAGALGVLYRSMPILLLGVLATTRELGLYTAPYRTVFAISTIGTLLPVAMFPILSSTYSENIVKFYKLQKYLFYVMFCMGMFISFAGMFFGNEIFGFLFGIEYMESVMVFKILIWMVLFNLVRSSFGFPIAAMGLQRLRSYTTAAGLILSVVLGLLLIQMYGIMGAAVSLLITEFIVIILVVYIYFNARRQHVHNAQ